MEFEENYDNPCWPESVPRYPYQNNSYLLIDQQQKLIDPVFQVLYTSFTLLHLLTYSLIPTPRCCGLATKLANDELNFLALARLII